MARSLLVFCAAGALALGAVSCNEEDTSPTTEGPSGGSGGEAGPSCECGARVCGDDGCGNSCGACGDANVCFSGQCIDEATCDLHGFPIVTSEAAFNRLVGGSLRFSYVASNVQSDVDPPFERLTVEVDTSKLDLKPGTYDLAELDIENCELCVRAYSFCKDDFECFNRYMPTEGTLVVEEAGQPGGKFKGRFEATKMAEVRIDKVTGEVEWFNNGKSWCLGDYSFDVEVPELATADSVCVPEGSGKDIGQNIADFPLQNCNGDFIDLHSRCGGTNAVWIVASAGWCGACESFVPKVGDAYKENIDKGLDIMIVVGEDKNGAPATLEYCKFYAEAKGIDPSQVYIDNDPNSWGATFGNINNYSNGSIGLPFSILLNGRSMEYVWSSASGSGDLYEVLDGLLEQE